MARTRRNLLERDLIDIPEEGDDILLEIAHLDDDAARRRYVDDRVNAGHAVSWPPGRNQPCWCGSGTKDQKCCDRPSA